MRMFLNKVLNLDHGRPVEAVRLNDITSGEEIVAMDLLDDFRLCYVKNIVVVHKVLAVVCELGSSIAFLVETI